MSRGFSHEKGLSRICGQFMNYQEYLVEHNENINGTYSHDNGFDSPELAVKT
jgi:hypothetical protein